jgi:predicted lipoprotein with Yx(FWY)xxD motif
VADAAWEHLRSWVGGGDPPPASGLIQFSRQATLAAIPPGDGNGLIARDELRNALGGIRTPAIDAPLGTYNGSSPCNPGALGFLAGQVVPFDGPTLARLYPTHDDYVAKVTASVQKAVGDGFILPEDGERLTADAKSSTIPNLAVAQPAPSTVQTRMAGELGTILTDRQGFALYTFDRDSPGSSSCTGDCAATWAPTLLDSGEPVSPQNLPGRLAMSTRPDGGRQVTYNDQPLYRYTGDLVNSDTNGAAIPGWRLVQVALP